MCRMLVDGNDGKEEEKNVYGKDEKCMEKW